MMPGTCFKISLGLKRTNLQFTRGEGLGEGIIGEVGMDM